MLYNFCCIRAAARIAKSGSPQTCIKTAARFLISILLGPTHHRPCCPAQELILETRGRTTGRPPRLQKALLARSRWRSGSGRCSAHNAPRRAETRLMWHHAVPEQARYVPCRHLHEQDESYPASEGKHQSPRRRIGATQTGENMPLGI
jgi:hypothetical protein